MLFRHADAIAAMVLPLYDHYFSRRHAMPPIISLPRRCCCHAGHAARTPYAAFHAFADIFQLISRRHACLRRLLRHFFAADAGAAFAAATSFFSLYAAR